MNKKQNRKLNKRLVKKEEKDEGYRIRVLIATLLLVAFALYFIIRMVLHSDCVNFIHSDDCCQRAQTNTQYMIGDEMINIHKKDNNGDVL